MHGYGGWAPEETPILGDYFEYASDPEIQGENVIYHAHVSPYGSMHDRACELY